MKSLREQFIDWLETMPADGEFDFGITTCAGYQFLKAQGLPVDWVGVWHWYGPGPTFDPHPFPAAIGEALQWAFDEWKADRPLTFGALRSRLTQDVSA